MKKLALVLSFVFAVAMIAPAFAADPQKTPAPAPAKVEKAGTTAAKDCSATCAKACGEKKEAAACCATKAGAAAPAAKPAAK